MFFTRFARSHWQGSQSARRSYTYPLDITESLAGIAEPYDFLFQVSRAEYQIIELLTGGSVNVMSQRRGPEGQAVVSPPTREALSDSRKL